MHASHRRQMLDILRRAIGAGAADRFQLRDVCRLDAAKLLVAFDALVDYGFVVRVADGGCRWHYRVTDAGRAAVSAGEIRFDWDRIEYDSPDDRSAVIDNRRRKRRVRR